MKTKVIITLTCLFPFISFAQQSANFSLAPNEILYAYASHPERGITLFAAADRDTKKKDRFVSVYYYSSDLSKKWDIHISPKEQDMDWLYNGNDPEKMTFSCLATKDFIYLFCSNNANNPMWTKLTVFKIDYEGKYEVLNYKTHFNRCAAVEKDGKVYVYAVTDPLLKIVSEFEYDELGEKGVLKKKEIKLPKKKCDNDNWFLHGFANGEFCFSCNDPMEIDKQGFLHSSSYFLQLDGKNHTSDFKIKPGEGYFPVPGEIIKSYSGASAASSSFGVHTNTLYDPAKKEFIFYGPVNNKEGSFLVKLNHMGFYASKFQADGSQLNAKMYLYSDLTKMGKAFMPNKSDNISFTLMNTDMDKYGMKIVSGRSGTSVNMNDHFEAVSNTLYVPAPSEMENGFWDRFNCFTMPSTNNSFIKKYSAKEMEFVKSLDTKCKLGIYSDKYFTADVNGGKLIVPNVKNNKKITVYFLQD